MASRIKGDFNDDGNLTIADVHLMLEKQLGGGGELPPHACSESGNLSNLSDADPFAGPSFRDVLRLVHMVAGNLPQETLVTDKWNASLQYELVDSLQGSQVDMDGNDSIVACPTAKKVGYGIQSDPGMGCVVFQSINAGEPDFLGIIEPPLNLLADSNHVDIWSPATLEYGLRSIAIRNKYVAVSALYVNQSGTYGWSQGESTGVVYLYSQNDCEFVFVHELLVENCVRAPQVELSSTQVLISNTADGKVLVYEIADLLSASVPGNPDPSPIELRPADNISGASSAEALGDTDAVIATSGEYGSRITMCDNDEYLLISSPRGSCDSVDISEQKCIDGYHEECNTETAPTDYPECDLCSDVVSAHKDALAHLKSDNAKIMIDDTTGALIHDLATDLANSCELSEWQKDTLTDMINHAIASGFDFGDDFQDFASTHPDFTALVIQLALKGGDALIKFFEDFEGMYDSIELEMTTTKMIERCANKHNGVCPPEKIAEIEALDKDGDGVADLCPFDGMSEQDWQELISQMQEWKSQLTELKNQNESVGLKKLLIKTSFSSKQIKEMQAAWEGVRAEWIESGEGWVQVKGWFGNLYTPKVPPENMVTATANLIDWSIVRIDKVIEIFSNVSADYKEFRNKTCDAETYYDPATEKPVYFLDGEPDCSCIEDSSGTSVSMDGSSVEATDVMDCPTKVWVHVDSSAGNPTALPPESSEYVWDGATLHDASPWPGVSSPKPVYIGPTLPNPNGWGHPIWHILVWNSSSSGATGYWYLQRRSGSSGQGTHTAGDNVAGMAANNNEDVACPTDASWGDGVTTITAVPTTSLPTFTINTPELAHGNVFDPSAVIGNTSNEHVKLSGNITDTGGDDPEVTIFWGTTDRGEMPFGWNGGNAPLGSLGVGSFEQVVSGLSVGATYYSRVRFTNSAGDTYSDAVSFTPQEVTFITPTPTPTPVVPTTSLTTITLRRADSNLTAQTGNWAIASQYYPNGDTTASWYLYVSSGQYASATNPCARLHYKIFGSGSPLGDHLEIIAFNSLTYPMYRSDCNSPLIEGYKGLKIGLSVDTDSFFSESVWNGTNPWLDAFDISIESPTPTPTPTPTPVVPTISLPTFTINPAELIPFDPPYSTSGNPNPAKVKLSAEITDTGGDDPEVTIYIGNVDRGTLPFGWSAGATPMGNLGVGSFETTQSGFSLDTTYYARFKFVNSAGEVYSDAVSFTTILTPLLLGGLTQAAFSGDTSIHVLGQDSFPINSRIVLDKGTPTEEYNQVIGYGSLQLKTPLKYDHLEGSFAELVQNTEDFNFGYVDVWKNVESAGGWIRVDRICPYDINVPLSTDPIQTEYSVPSFQFGTSISTRCGGVIIVSALGEGGANAGGNEHYSSVYVFRRNSDEDDTWSMEDRIAWDDDIPSQATDLTTKPASGTPPDQMNLYRFGTEVCVGHDDSVWVSTEQTTGSYVATYKKTSDESPMWNFDKSFKMSNDICKNALVANDTNVLIGNATENVTLYKETESMESIAMDITRYGKHGTFGLSHLVNNALDYRWSHARPVTVVGTGLGVAIVYPHVVNDCGCHLMLVVKNGDELLLNGGHECANVTIDYDEFNLSGDEILTAYFVEYDTKCEFVKRHDKFNVNLSVFKNAPDGIPGR